MELNAVQQDALVELLNIGFGRAGASLSKLTQQRVLLDVPQVDIHPVTHLTHSLGRLMDERVASVHQVFSGPVTGDALRYALVVTAGFRLRESAVTGYVVIVLTVQSLKRLLDALDRWQRIQA
jgi:hypothetical protein